MPETFFTYTTQFNPEDQMYYLRLEELIKGTCESVWKVDIARFKTYEETFYYEENLPTPEEQYLLEMKCFERSN